VEGDFVDDGVRTILKGLYQETATLEGKKV